MDWQPIETAPKDGTYILVWSEREGWRGNPRMVCATWEPSGTGAWAIYGAGPTRHSEQWLDRGIIPTHWMPLPEPPKEGS